MLQTEVITIQVAPEAAQVYKTAPANRRKKLELLLSIQLLWAVQPRGSLEYVMREISQKAQARGLTPEILQEILAEDE